MAVARPWLPEGAMTSSQAASAIGATIGGWVRHWFHAPALRAAPRWVRWPLPAGEGNEGWSLPRPLSSCISVQCRVDVLDIIGHALIAISSLRDHQHANDRRLLRSAASHVLADLDDRLAPLVVELNIPKPQPEGGRSASLFCLSIEDDAGHDVIRVLADPTVVIAFVKQDMKGSKDDARLTGRVDAVADARIACAALLGRATLAYADVRGLAVGDVVVLQSSRDAGCDLLVEGKVAAHGAVRIAAADNDTFFSPIRTT